MGNLDYQILIPMVAAIIAAGASIVGAAIGAWNQVRLKKIEGIRAEQNARREYEYEARKRIYHEFEPLIFILSEDSIGAYGHIKELANMASLGQLHVKLSTITEKDKDGDNNDYLKTTIYKLILPMAVFRLMQRHLTSFDLHLDNYFRLQYALAKCLYFSCADNYYIALGGKAPSDFKLCLICEFGGLLKDSEETAKKNHPNHIVVNILNINTGMIDSLANSLIKFDDNDKIYRIIS
jgi:hypothetical protein